MTEEQRVNGVIALVACPVCGGEREIKLLQSPGSNAIASCTTCWQFHHLRLTKAQARGEKPID